MHKTAERRRPYKTFKKWPNSRRQRNATSYRHVEGYSKGAFLTNAQKKATSLQTVHATDTEHSFWLLL